MKDEINSILDNLLISKNISSKIYSKLVVKDFKICKFRILAKVHKEKFSLRPIVNSINSITSNFCILIDCILKTFIFKMDSFILDSQNMIQKLEGKYFEKDSFLFSCDFESLYSNIRLDDALEKICDFLSNKLINEELSIKGFHDIMEIIFNYNFFSFNNIIYKQILGIAMGSIAGPSIANIYVFILEKSFLNSHRDITYFRFIDDIFLITPNSFEISNLADHFNYLKLNCVHNDIVNFLDLNIKLDKTTSKLKFSIFFKKTNTFSYLLNSSNHKDSIFKNIPKSLFIRIRRICSNYSDYLYFSHLLYFQLIERGYDKKILSQNIRTLGRIERKNFIDYKPKKDFQNEKNYFLFVLAFKFNYLNLEKTFSFIFDSLKSKYNWLELYNLKIIYKRESNLRDVFVFNKKETNCSKKKFNKCKKNNCMYCKFACDDSEILINKLSLPILSNSNCDATNLVYVIKCLRCKIYYIGQTKNIKKRLSNHFFNIKHFEPYVNCVNDVSQHFKLKNHNYEKDFIYFIIKNDIIDLQARLNFEAFVINLFTSLNVKIINEFIPFIYNINHLKLN